MGKKDSKIIHLLDKERAEEGEARYACIQSCYPTFEKLTIEEGKVTCTHCRNIVDKKISERFEKND